MRTDLFDSILWSRRSFLAASTSSLLVASRGWSGEEFVQRRPSLGDNPFQLGIASGDPDEHGFVIWTRLAPKPFEGGGMPLNAVAVQWEVAEDEKFSKIVRKGESIALPQLAHSVHVEVEGLQAGRWYWYRFMIGNEISPVGRARTMPALEETPEQLRFAFASCQHWESGYYTAYQHMTNEDLDLVIHLGDYIYEGSTGKGGVREHIGTEIQTLADYRTRHAQYKTDTHLQAVHAQFPWLVTWDDHELDNNCAGDISEEKDVESRAFLARRANAYQAYYEHMPLRRRSIPAGPNMELFRRVRFGQLAEFNVLDTRQYRTDQPNGDGARQLNGGVFDPKATMLGERQRDWLFQGLLESPAQWNVLAQQVMMARVDLGPGPFSLYAMDQWSGYDVERKQLLDFIGTRRISNPIVITGDIHSNWVNDLMVEFDERSANPVATEFVGTSITTGGDQGLKLSPESLMSKNSFVKFHNGEHGYVRCSVTSKAWQSDYQVVEYVSRPGASLVTRASFVVENGVAGVKKS